MSLPVVGCQVQLFQVEVVNKDSSLLRVIEAHQKVGESAFPCSRVAHHCGHFARLELDVELPNHLQGEEDPFKIFKSSPDVQASMDT